MRNILRSVLFFMLTAVFLSAAAAPAAAQTILKDTALTGSVPQKSDATVIRSRSVIVNEAFLRGKRSTSVVVPLFDRRTVRIDRVELREAAPDIFIWRGRVAGEANDQTGGSAIFVIKRGIVIGNIFTADNRAFQIRYLGEGVHSLREIDGAAFPDEGPPRQPPVRGWMPYILSDTCTTDPATEIDVMVVYTPAARIAAGGTAAMEAAVFLMVEETNQSYFNSDIIQRLRLVHIAEVNYAETGNIAFDLDRLRYTGDAFLNEVQPLRETYGADVVSLILDHAEPDACGLAYFIASPKNVANPFAYSVAVLSCAIGNLTFAHELGHNMGADHDTANITSGSIFTFDHGFIHPSTTPADSWRTIMSYKTSPPSTRIQYWSNPNLLYPAAGGAPMGTALTEDNHRVLNTTALTVANFRCRIPGPEVWMRDLWDDDGTEPDPLSPMWTSPYIWVRNHPDSQLVHQHEHENPIFGQTNYIYVKVHNSSGLTHTGELDLRFARASTGLKWPNDWTPVSTTPVAVSIPPSSTRIVEIPWSNVPNNPDLDNHYCMVAMWTEDPMDQMTFPLTPDINLNTLNNNNVIWRNMNILDMTPDQGEDASFILRNASEQSRPVNLTIKSPGDPYVPFFQQGQVTVTFENKLFVLVRKGFEEQEGVVIEGNKFIVTNPNGVTFANIPLRGRYEGKVKLTFRLNANAPLRVYRVTVAQAETDGAMAGGVTYEIYPFEH